MQMSHMFPHDFRNGEGRRDGAWIKNRVHTLVLPPSSYLAVSKSFTLWIRVFSPDKWNELLCLLPQMIMRAPYRQGWSWVSRKPEWVDYICEVEEVHPPEKCQLPSQADLMNPNYKTPYPNLNAQHWRATEGSLIKQDARYIGYLLSGHPIFPFSVQGL
jgi:hypothetical protein